MGLECQLARPGMPLQLLSGLGIVVPSFQDGHNQGVPCSSYIMVLLPSFGKLPMESYHESFQGSMAVLRLDIRPS